jgi:hypothetical protein
MLLPWSFRSPASWTGSTVTDRCKSTPLRHYLIFGGVSMSASREDADRSRETDLLRGMSADPALFDVAVREFDVLDAPTATTAPASLLGTG